MNFLSRGLLDDVVVLDIVFVVHIHDVDLHSLTFVRMMRPSHSLGFLRLSILLAWVQNSVTLDKLIILSRTRLHFHWLAILGDSLALDTLHTLELTICRLVARRYINTRVSRCPVHFKCRGVVCMALEQL